jgi:predicted membrane protein
MNLGSLDLRSVRIEMGVGEVRVDLRGKPTRDYNVNIQGGVGQATVYLPRDVGVVAKAAGGIGNISVHGLEKRGGQYINPAHENAPVTIHLNVEGGVGEINLIAE